MKVRSARLSQFLFLALFIVLFINTDYRGDDNLSAAVNGFFRADPLVALSTMLAVKSFSWLLLPGLLLLLATALLGRFFCGWVCPLGTILDCVTTNIGKRSRPTFLGPSLKYWLLLPLMASALFNLNLAGFFDPLAILVRALTLFAYPLFGEGFRQGWVGLYHLLDDRRDILAPAYTAVRDHILPFRETFYPLALASTSLFLGIIVMERYGARTWCRTLCPLGTLLQLAARFSPFVRTPATLCPDCHQCRDHCPASCAEDLLQQEECMRCMTCVLACRRTLPAFKIQNVPASRQPWPERRLLLGSIVSGLFLAHFFRFRSPGAEAKLLRPPGVRDEREFLAQCVRCGECLKVCLRSVLYPAALQAGVEGLFTPLLLPRLGYCEYNCTLCGQVCPTGAIPNLPQAEKRRAVIGKAVLDRNHCLPFAQKVNCIVCEEHCPIPKKAIRFELIQETTPSGNTIRLKKPYVVNDLCNGCGICEYVCPLEGKAGIEVFAVKDRSPLQETSTPGLKAGTGYDEGG